MKKLLITSILLTSGITVHASDNWQSSNGDPWRNSTGLCWRSGAWTPATAHPDCDGALKPQTVPVPDPKAEAPRAEAPKPVAVKVTYGADTFFDFDKSTIKPEGKTKLNELIANLKTVSLEVVIVVGHTDSIGSDAYNMKLGERRANAVKAYLVSNGIEQSRVYTESKGERQPIADNKTAAGRAKNRRVEIEVIGSK